MMMVGAGGVSPSSDPVKGGGGDVVPEHERQPLATEDFPSQKRDYIPLESNGLHHFVTRFNSNAVANKL
jgi:hypothetical protein